MCLSGLFETVISLDVAKHLNIHHIFVICDGQIELFIKRCILCKPEVEFCRCFFVKQTQISYECYILSVLIHVTNLLYDHQKTYMAMTVNIIHEIT